jgi:hypothetical protein
MLLFDCGSWGIIEGMVDIQEELDIWKEKVIKKASIGGALPPRAPKFAAMA